MNLIRFLFALIASPAVLNSLYILIKTILSFAGIQNYKYAPFWAGILCYGVFQVLFYKPFRLYIFGHELTHAIAGILSGASIKNFRVGKRSGSVVLDKDNIWITLSPYFIPLYSFAVLCLYFAAGYFLDISLIYSYFLFFLGFTVAFHFALTVFVIKIGQPDLKVYGLFFSLIIILAVNAAVFSILLVLAFPREINASLLFSNYYYGANAVYKDIIDGIAALLNKKSFI
ncbi:MAG: hypothetical protein LBH29_04740 [Elusimicrobiota bacterium]|nr:hypothetical protein [Elusimicrobiota bacterium]